MILISVKRQTAKSGEIFIMPLIELKKEKKIKFRIGCLGFCSEEKLNKYIIKEL